MKKHTILYLAASPSGTDPRALDREVRAIRAELERSCFRERFELVTRWAVEPLDLIRGLRELKPTVVHFSGHSGQNGLFFQNAEGRAQLVTPAALAEAFGAAGASVKLVVLSACYSEMQADALLGHVDYVVGLGGSIHEDAARIFATGFYGGLGEHQSIMDAYRQGRAAIELQGLPDGDCPQLRVRDRADAGSLILAAAVALDTLPPKPQPEQPSVLADPPLPASDSTLGGAHSMLASSTEELARAERETAEIMSIRRPAPLSRNKVIAIASTGAGIFVLLLLVIPHDIISPPAPVGTPQIVLGAFALTACLLWAVNPKRRYLRFAVSLLAVIVLPASPVWPLISEFSGSAGPDSRLPVVTQIAMICVVCLCLILDYRTHRDQDTLQRVLGLALDKLTFSRRLKGLSDERRHQIEVIDLTDRYKLVQNKERNGLILGVAVVTCAVTWRSVNISFRARLPTSSQSTSRGLLIPSLDRLWQPNGSSVSENNKKRLLPLPDAFPSGSAETSQPSTRPKQHLNARPRSPNERGSPPRIIPVGDQVTEWPKSFQSSREFSDQLYRALDTSYKAWGRDSREILVYLHLAGGHITVRSETPAAMNTASYDSVILALHIQTVSASINIKDGWINCALIIRATHWTGNGEENMAVVEGSERVQSNDSKVEQIAFQECATTGALNLVERKVLRTLSLPAVPQGSQSIP